MSDDRRSREPDDFSEFGSLFDEAEPTGTVPQVEPVGSSGPPTDDVAEPLDQAAIDQASMWSAEGDGSGAVAAEPVDVAEPVDFWTAGAHGATDATGVVAQVEPAQPPIEIDDGYAGLADDGYPEQQWSADGGQDRYPEAAAQAAEYARADDPPYRDEPIRFDAAETDSLPHWTEPAEAGVPRFEEVAIVDEPPLDDVDPWSTFSSESPVWQEDQADGTDGYVDEYPAPQPSADVEVRQRRRVSRGDEGGELDQRSAPSGRVGRTKHRIDDFEGVREAPAAGRGDRITIGTDPSGMPRRDPRERGGRGARRAGPTTRRPTSVHGTHAASQRSGRDLPMAIGVGLLLAGVFVAALTVSALQYWAVVGLVTIILVVAAFEFYGKVAEKGYRPAVIPGVATCAAAPLVAYWLGDAALPLVFAFGFMAIAGSFVGAHGVESGPLPNMSITTLGIVWIGLLGSFAMLILRFSSANAVDYPSSDHFGTDTLFLLALGVVANDTGALLVGSLAGRTPLRPWISPNKTVEGLIGGSALTILVLLGVKMLDRSTTWVSYGDVLMLAIVISVMAPMGDLVESMMKRNLDVKDFGTILKGHGGVLDRFDAFLFVLPAVYYLTEVLQPWRVG